MIGRCCYVIRMKGSTMSIMKTISLKSIFLSLGIIAFVGFFFVFQQINEKDKRPVVLLPSYKTASYTVDGQIVNLVDGVSEVSAAPGSASRIVTRYFGNEVKHDFNGDGREDVVFLLTQETGGTGMFYYIVAALNTADGYRGSQAYFLGDRIAPQTTELGKGNIVIVNYADRNPGESFTVQPSVGKSLYILLDPRTMQFGIVEQNFEGEADPAVMSLDMNEWNWIQTKNDDGTIIIPKKPGVFTLRFLQDGTFSIKTDCNGVSGSYSTKGDSLSFSQMMSTLMYCEGSQQDVFTSALGNVSTYHFTSKGELILDLKSGSGSLLFR